MAILGNLGARWNSWIGLTPDGALSRDGLASAIGMGDDVTVIRVQNLLDNNNTNQNPFKMYTKLNFQTGRTMEQVNADYRAAGSNTFFESTHGYEGAHVEAIIKGSHDDWCIQATSSSSRKTKDFTGASQLEALAELNTYFTRVM